MATSAAHSFLIWKSDHLEKPSSRGGEFILSSLNSAAAPLAKQKTHLEAHHGKGECIESNSCGPEATKLQESQFLGPTDQARHHSAFGQDKKKIPPPCWAIQIIQQPLSELRPPAAAVAVAGGAAAATTANAKSTYTRCMSWITSPQLLAQKCAYVH